MSLWDSITGRSRSKAAASPTPEPTTDFSSGPALAPAIDSSQLDVSSFLGSNLADPSALHPLAGLNQDTLDYLALEEDALSNLPGARTALPSRGWSDDLCYGTGVTYLTALSLGGVWGLTEGLNRLPPTAPPKLKLNSVLNSVTRRGPFLGNSAGVVALTYNIVNSTIGHFRGKHDVVNSVVAGGFSGALFKSTRGTRPMLISSAVVASIAAGWTMSKDLLL